MGGKGGEGAPARGGRAAPRRGSRPHTCRCRGAPDRNCRPEVRAAAAGLRTETAGRRCGPEFRGRGRSFGKEAGAPGSGAGICSRRFGVGPPGSGPAARPSMARGLYRAAPGPTWPDSAGAARGTAWPKGAQGDPDMVATQIQRQLLGNIAAATRTYSRATPTYRYIAEASPA